MTTGNNREFLSTDGSKYYIKPPTTEDIRGADWTYSKTYTKSLVEGITTSAEMIDILRMRGIIGTEYDQRSKELAGNLNKLVVALGMAKDNDEKSRLALEAADARDELFRWNQRFRGPMNHTCEQMADESRLEYLTSCMVCNSEGSRIWKDHNSYMTEKDNDFALRSKVEVMLFLQGIESNFMENTPEAMAMRQVEDDLTAELMDKIALETALEQEVAQDKEETTASDSIVVPESTTVAVKSNDKKTKPVKNK